MRAYEFKRGEYLFDSVTVKEEGYYDLVIPFVYGFTEKEAIEKAKSIIDTIQERTKIHQPDLTNTNFGFK